LLLIDCDERLIAAHQATLAMHAAPLRMRQREKFQKLGSSGPPLFPIPAFCLLWLYSNESQISDRHATKNCIGARAGQAAGKRFRLIPR
jgi:hypothetical protein